MRPRFACWTSAARLDAAKPVLNWIPSNSGPRSGLWDGSAFDHPRSSSKLARHLVENEGGRAPVPKLNGMGTLTVWSWQILQKLDPCQCLNVIMRPHRVKHRARKGCERRIAEERIPCYEALLAGRFQVNHLRQSNQPFRIYITIEIVIRIRIIRTFIFLYYSIGEN